MSDPQFNQNTPGGKETLNPSQFNVEAKVNNNPNLEHPAPSENTLLDPIQPEENQSVNQVENYQQTVDKSELERVQVEIELIESYVGEQEKINEKRQQPVFVGAQTFNYANEYENQPIVADADIDKETYKKSQFASATSGVRWLVESVKKALKKMGKGARVVFRGEEGNNLEEKVA